MFKKLGAVLALLVILLTLAPAGVPVQISYVYSESMSPTIETNEGFIIVPVDGIQSGDIITFWSAQREQFVTHRVVGETDTGYVTRGDNNPATDQAAGAPPVPERAIIGEVLTLRGQPVTIPGYGGFVNTLQTHQPVALGIVIGLIILHLLNGGQKRRSERSLTRTQTVLGPILIISFIAGTGLLLFGAPAHELSFVGVAGQSEAPQTITVGEPHDTTVTVNKSSSPLTHRFVTVAGASVVNTTRNQSGVTLGLRIPPRSTTGVHSIRIRIHQYPAVLPRTVVAELHRIHPGLSAGLSMLVFMAPLCALSLLLVDRKAPVRVPQHRRLRQLSGGDNP